MVVAYSYLENLVWVLLLSGCRPERKTIGWSKVSESCSTVAPLGSELWLSFSFLSTDIPFIYYKNIGLARWLRG